MLTKFCMSVFNTNIFSLVPLVIKVVIFFFVQGNMQNMIKARVKSLTSSTIQELLGGLKKPVRLASQSPNGFPLISTLWFLYHDDYFWCITQKSTLLRRNLATNQKCAFEIALIMFIAVWPTFADAIDNANRYAVRIKSSIALLHE